MRNRIHRKHREQCCLGVIEVKGNMSPIGLTTNVLIAHAEEFHGNTEIVGVNVKGERRRTSWGEVGARSRRLSSALVKMGLRKGDRVGTIAPNTCDHLELLYAISGFGGIAHTINPRLFPDEVVYIINHAGDKTLFVDPAYVGILIGHRHLFETVENIYITGPKQNEVAARMNGFKFLVDLFETGDPAYEWPDLDEDDAAVVCYTSGTTGDPKGVLYSHKSIVVHASVVSLPDSFCLSATDTVMPVVPMFHVNAWGVPYASAMVGCRLVLPGPNLDGHSLIELMNQERVTMALAIPTIWEEVLEILRDAGASLESVKRILSGGTAVPSWMIKEFDQSHGVRLIHGWGMTETSPLGSVNSPLGKHLALDGDEKLEQMSSAGRPHWAMRLKIVDEEGTQLPNDGVSEGSLYVKGPTVVESYMSHEAPATDEDGWFDTGDVGTIDGDGFLTLTDRSKDLIKSGGEWISSILLEEIIRQHPLIHDAAVIGVNHKKWTERPIIIAQAVEDESPTETEVLSFFKDKVAKWQIPDAVVMVDELPLGSTGKPIKRVLREQYVDYLLEGNT